MDTSFHLSGPDGSGGALTSSGGSARARITKVKLSTVVNESDFKVKNLHDHKWKHRPTEEIVKEALSHLNENVDYSVWKCNCEHFATWCRYGKFTSLQVAYRLWLLDYSSTGIDELIL
ncbi:phospholipase A and acyltransferase 4-like [Scomber scombrus]|uniref:Phospholipase A and acyltransferase 4-like n=1 Tax=Scomber scombrus TaxID=13677 RepID=A0AAV1P177_SCOSC